MYNCLTTKKADRHQSLHSKLLQCFVAWAPGKDAARILLPALKPRASRPWKFEGAVIYQPHAIIPLSREHSFVLSLRSWLNQQVRESLRIWFLIEAASLSLVASPLSFVYELPPALPVRGGDAALLWWGERACSTSSLFPHLCYPAVGHGDFCDSFVVEEPVSLQALGAIAVIWV